MKSIRITLRLNIGKYNIEINKIIKETKISTVLSQSFMIAIVDVFIQFHW